MKVSFLRFLTVFLGVVLSLSLATPAQASQWSLNQTPSGNPGCIKTVWGPNCDRANAWGIAAEMGLQASKRTTGQDRATAMKSAIAVIASPLTSKARVSEITGSIGNSLNKNQSLCMKEELQRTTNRVTAKSGLVKSYYSYLDRTYKVWKKAPLASSYKAVLDSSKGVVIATLNDSEQRQLRTNLTGCLNRR